MNTENAIKTIFEFATNGYETAAQQINDLTTAISTAKKENKSANKQYQESTKELDNLVKKWEQYEKTITSATSKADRESFAKTKEQIVEQQAAIAKLTTQIEKKSTESKKDAETLKQSEQAAKTYKAVLDQLGKGVDKAEVSIKSLKDAKKTLQTEFEKTNTNTDRYRELSKELAVVDNAIKTVTNAQREQVKTQSVAGNSIEAMRQKVSALNAEWKTLDMGSERFKEVKVELASTTEELKNAEQEVGIFNRNVGNYEQGMQKALSMGNPFIAQLIGMSSGAGTASGATKALTATVGGLSTALKALLANPVVAILAAAVAIFMAFKKAINSSEEATNKFNAIMAPLGRILDGILSVLQAVVGWVLSGIEAFMDLAMASAKLLESIPFIGEFFKEANKQIERSIELEREKAALDKKIRENIVEEAKNTRNIAELRTKSLEKDKYNAAERLKFTEDAIALEKKNADVAVEIAKEKLRIAEEQASWAENTKETEEELAQLRANVFKAETDHFNKVRKLGEKRQSFLNEEKKEVEDAAKAKQAAAKSAMGAQKRQNDEYIKATADRLKAIEDLATAEAQGETELVEHYKQALAHKQDAFDVASKKRLTLSQEELDQLELNEYLSAQNIESIRNEAIKKEKDAQAKKVEAYLKATQDVILAEQTLLDAQKRGNEKEVAIYEKKLQQKREELAKFNADEIILNEEQQSDLLLSKEQYRIKLVEGYQQMKLAEFELDNQFAEAKTVKEQEVIDNQREILQKQIEIQVKALQALGENADNIVIDVKNSTKQVQDDMATQLQNSLAVIEQFAGESKNAFYRASSSIAGLLAGAFDLYKIKANEAGLSAEELSKKTKEAEMKLAEVGAAATLSTLNAVVETLNASFEREKEQIDQLYEYQAKASERAYSQEQKKLEQKFKNGQITEAKYKLESLKAERAQAEKQKQIEKDKANAIYEVELKQFKAKQAQDIISATIATALAVTQTLAIPPLAAAVGALGAVQIALIASQKAPERPKFEKGGSLRFETIQGNSHAKGGVPITVGGKEVAEAEGDEGMLIVSKKAIKDSYMRKLLAKVMDYNDKLSGKSNSDDMMFEDGGQLTFEDFINKAKSGVRVSFDHGFLGIGAGYRVNGKKVKDSEINTEIERVATEIAEKEYQAYIDKLVADLEKKEADLTSNMNKNIQSNSYLSSLGIGSVADLNKVTANKESELKSIESQIADYRKLADAKVESLKEQLQYEEKLAEFEKQRTQAADELANTTLEFNKSLLADLHESGQIATDEYMSMLDQVTLGYGVKTQDIINLKKKEIEAVKKLINEERNAEIAAANEVAKYRQDALAQLRTDWKDNYNATTKLIIEDVEAAQDAVSELTGSDLERFNQILAISREIEKLNKQYQDNESLLSDGVIQSREERAELLAQQKQIKEELALKEKEAEEAKKAFEEERAKNMQSALKEYENANFESLLSQIKELGSSLQEEGNKWSLDKELASELDGVLKDINTKYDAQISAQDKIIEGLDAEIKKVQLLHDQKVANIKAEEVALKSSFESQKKEIEAAFDKATSHLRAQATSLSQLLAEMRAAGLAAGLGEYEKALEVISKEADELKESSSNVKSYSTGGAIDLGGGVFNLAGASHAQGGIPVSVGGRQIAEVEGAEQMLVVNKLAAADPNMHAALERISVINERYTNIPLVAPSHIESQAPFDYDLLAQKIGAEINSRPVRTNLYYSEVDQAMRVDVLAKKMRYGG